MNDTALDQVVFPESLQSIGSQSFANSGVKTVYFADSLIDIAEDAFEGCNLDAFVNENMIILQSQDRYHLQMAGCPDRIKKSALLLRRPLKAL